MHGKDTSMSGWQPTALEQQRLAKLQQLQELGFEPYPLRVNRTHKVAEARQAFELIEADDDPAPVVVSVCGRLVGVRDMGRTVFATIEDGSGRIQLYSCEKDPFCE